MLTWQYGITVDGSRFVQRPRAAPGVEGHVPVFGAANPDWRAYETELRGLLGEIDLTGAGHALLELLADTGRHVRIFPLTDAGSPEDTHTAAYDARRSAVAGAPMLSRRTNQPLRMRGDDLSTPAVEQAGDVMVGLGGGSDSFILFSPARLSAVAPDARYGYLEPVVMLGHEFVHALFMAQGSRRTGDFRSRSLPVAWTPYLNELWETPEEFSAIVVENILASELRIRGLRGAHARFSGGTLLQDAAHTLLDPPALMQAAPTGPGRAPSVGGTRVRGPLCPAARRRPSIADATPSQMFAWSYQRELRMFAAEQPALWRRLARVAAPYNPVRDVECGTSP